MNKVSPKPKVGDYIKIVRGISEVSKSHHDKIAQVIEVGTINQIGFDWYIDVNIGNKTGLWPDEFIIVSTVTKEQKQHLLDLIKSI